MYIWEIITQLQVEIKRLPLGRALSMKILNNVKSQTLENGIKIGIY